MHPSSVEGVRRKTVEFPSHAFPSCRPMSSFLGAPEPSAWQALAPRTNLEWVVVVAAALFGLTVGRDRSNLFMCEKKYYTSRDGWLMWTTICATRRPAQPVRFDPSVRDDGGASERVNCTARHVRRAD